jgi:hypothetical protein
MDYTSGEITGCDMIDADADGIKELFVVKELTEDNQDTLLSNYCFDDGTEELLNIYTDVSAAGGADLLVDYDDNKVYLKKDYTTAGTIYDCYSLWEHGWNTFAEYQDEYSDDTNTRNVLINQWNGEILNTYDDWWAKEQSFSETMEQVRNNTEIVQNILIENENINAIAQGYKMYLQSLGQEYFVAKGDVNQDETEEVVFAVKDYAFPWRKNIESFNELDEENFANGKDDAVSLITMFQKEDAISIRTQYIEDITSLKEIHIADTLELTSESDTIFRYSVTNTEQWSRESVEYSGNIKQLIMNSSLYTPAGQIVSVAEYTFLDDGTVKFSYRNEDGSEISSQIMSYTIDENTKTLHISDEDVDWSFVYDESEGIFFGDVVSDIMPDNSEVKTRRFLVPLEDFPTIEQIGDMSKYFGWNIE